MDLEPYLQQIDAAVAGIRAAVVVRPVVRVPAGDNLQAALDSAPNGAEIRLAPGAEYVGAFHFPPNYTSRFTTITTDLTLPPGRISPTLPLAVIRSDGSEPSAIRPIGPEAHHYELMGVRFNANVGGYGDIVRLGLGTETDASQLAHDFIVDRCVLRGDPLVGQKRGIALNANRIAVTNCDIREIWREGQDNQALGGWNTEGGHVVINNHLESGGEVILYGGARSPFTPDNIIIEDNVITRPIEWHQTGALRSVKNLLELKFGTGFRIRRNQLWNNWPQAQAGWAIVFTPRNGNRLEDITFEDNEVWNVSMGLNVAGSAYEGTNAYVPPFRKLYVRNNLFVINKAQFGGNGWFAQIGGIETDESSEFEFEQNTILHDGALVGIYRGNYDDPDGVSQDGKPLRGFLYRSNLSRAGAYGFWSESSYGGLAGAIPGAIIEQNVIAESRQQAILPSGNQFPTETEFRGAFIDYAAGDYRLREAAWPGIGRR